MQDVHSKGRRYGSRSRKRPVRSGSARAVRENVREQVTGRTESRRTNSFEQTGIAQLSQEAAFAMRKRSTKLKLLPESLGNLIRTKASTNSVELAVERVIEQVADTGDLLLQSNNYKLSKEYVGRKLSKERIILNWLQHP